MSITPVLSKQDISDFRNEIYSYYHRMSRPYPWRETYNPYYILVSEFMLQQTQTDRVLPKYLSFIEIFPIIHVLADASRKDVLAEWKGLGYNRRAMYLHETARSVVKDYGGNVPDDPDILETMPGIGPYTAAAVATFSHNKPYVFIETNIRSAYLHHFFADKDDVTDKQIYALAELALDSDNPREWHYALMDYGAMIKKKHGNPNRRSKHHTTQTPFEGSRRQKRGKILSELLTHPSLTSNEIARKLNEEDNEISSILNDLEKEGFLVRDGESYSLFES